MVQLYSCNLILKENGKINFQCVNHEYRQFLMIGVISILSPVSDLMLNMPVVVFFEVAPVFLVLVFVVVIFFLSRPSIMLITFFFKTKMINM